MKAQKAAPFGLDAVTTVSKHEIVYQRIVEALVSGQIPMGRKLTSRKLAHELGTSDMPVRSALLKLQALQALAPLPNGSLVLPQMTRSRFIDLMRARVVCEGEASSLACFNIKKGDFNKIHKECAALSRAAENYDIETYMLKNFKFKFAIYHVSRSPSLIFLIEMLWLQVGPFLSQFSTQFKGNIGGDRKMNFYHERALKALEKRDAAGVRQAIITDILEGEAFILEYGTFADE